MYGELLDRSTDKTSPLGLATGDLFELTGFYRFLVGMLLDLESWPGSIGTVREPGNQKNH